MSKITWKYNRFGHVEVWNGPETRHEADLYIQEAATALHKYHQETGTRLTILGILTISRIE